MKSIHRCFRNKYSSVSLGINKNTFNDHKVNIVYIWYGYLSFILEYFLSGLWRCLFLSTKPCSKKDTEVTLFAPTYYPAGPRLAPSDGQRWKEKLPVLEMLSMSPLIKMRLILRASESQCMLDTEDMLEEHGRTHTMRLISDSSHIFFSSHS